MLVRVLCANSFLYFGCFSSVIRFSCPAGLRRYQDFPIEAGSALVDQLCLLRSIKRGRRGRIDMAEASLRYEFMRLHN